jgi:glycosyltransferase involved in cell wall biosynthesis
MKKKILLKGPLLTRSGYGEQARFALRSLRSREDLFEIFIQPLKWGQTSWINEDTPERNWIDQTIEKTIGYIQQGGKFDISLQVTIPNEFEKLAPVNIGYTAGIETTKVAHQWIQKANIMDRIIVVSEHSKNVFTNSQYEAHNQQTGDKVLLKTQVPIESVGYPIKTFDSVPNLSLKLPTSFNFLTVAQFGPRKNLTNTIKWFVEEFRNEDVGLVVKSNIAKNCLMDRERLKADLTKLLKKQGDRTCKVYLLHGDMTDEEMHSLYQDSQIHAFLSLPHGEGFGLPLFEAAYSELPVVTVGWSGQLDFLVDERGQEHFYNVAFDLHPVQKEVIWDGVVVKDSMWAYARENSAKQQMRACYDDVSGGNIKYRLREMFTERFSHKKMYDKFITSMGFQSIKVEEDYIFVSDLFQNQYIGGAELSLQTLIDAIPDEKTGKTFNSSNVTEDLIIDNKDKIWIFGNIAQLPDDIIKFASENLNNYYFIEYDYKYCEYRNPILYEFLEDEQCDYATSEKGKLITTFINNSKKTFYMSEAQRDIHIDHLKNLNGDNLFVLSSTFNSNFFENIEKYSLNEKTDKWLILGSRSWVKGSNQSEKWCKDNNLDYEVISGLKPEEVLEKMSKAKGVCFLPTGYDTCPRFVIEAKLLGCQLHLNEYVQHANEDWFNTDNLKDIKSYLLNRKRVFWDEVR